MKIAFNPSTVAALTTPPNNKDITFDLKGHSIFAQGVEFKGTDTNTWRDIKINNVSIGSHTLDLRNGSNTTLTNTNGIVTINSTWRPVVDNLTSDSTTSSLSAKQGKVLKALIDGKSNSDHNHDGRYVRYYAVTTLDCNNLASGLTVARVNATNAADAYHSAYLYISDVGTPFQIQIPDSNIAYIYKRYYKSGKWSGWFKLNAGYADSAGSVAWANVTGKPSSYTPSAHTHAWNSLTHSSTTENQAILTNGKANGWKLQTLNIARWDNAANNAHSHANKSVLDGITSALVNSWNTAYNFVSNITGTDTDKVINKWEEIVNFLAGITEDNKLNTLLNSKLSIQQLSAKDILTTKTNNALFWVDTKGNASTITTGPFTDHPYALLSVTNYNQNAENHKFFYRSRLAFSSAGDIKVASCHHEFEYQQDETWYNVLTSKNSGINGSTIKLNGTSITVYSSGTADGRYVKKSGDTMQGVLTIDTTNFGALTIKRNDDAYGASIQFRGKSSVYGYIGLNNGTKDKQFLRWSSDTLRIYTILDTSSTYISNGKGVINGTTITQVDNATNSTNSTNARKLVNWYSARPTSLNAQFGDGSLRIFYATSSTTEGKPAEDSHILHLAWDNTGGYDAQLAVHVHSGKVSTRAQNGGTWQPWKTLAFANEIPTSLKNPYALTISLNGTSQGPYDGSAAKNINITPGSIGAAVSNHSHDYLVVNSADDKSFNSAYHNFQVLYAGGGNRITGKPANVDAFGLFKFRAASGYSGQMLLANGGSLYIRSSEDAKMTNTLAWKTILDSSNYSGILDSRYYTESEVNSLLDAKLNRQNLSYGTWNPRGYHLAADYHYNGGDLSISESGGKIHVSVNGYFWQNKGQYRVLDTSDIGDIRDSVTLHQYLSATDAAWYPLVWGGNAHKNTSDSTGAVYKSYDKLSWQTSSQTLYATNIQTNNIKNLSIGGGIYWNPWVEATTNNTDGASITLVRQGVAGGTTLVLSQMNDTNDTIQFKTNTAARLYHNSYPILTTQNTYVSNNKGYINGTEITQVNNSDKVDNRHAISTTPNTGIIYKAAIYTNYSLTSYWVRLASIHSISQNGEFVATIHVQSGHFNPGRNAILLVYLRGNASSFMSKSFKICCNSNYNPNRFRLYYKDSDKTSEIWYQTTGQWDGIITTVISQSAEGQLYEGLTLYSGNITAVQTPSVSTYLSAQVSTITDNISGNASTATKLQTARSIWGQSFDGTDNVSGSLSEVGNIHFKVDNSYDIGSDAAASRYIYTHWLGARSGRNLELGANNSGYGQGLCIDTNLNVGIGTNSPAYKLHVNGTFRATNSTVSDLFVNTGDATLKIYTGITADAQNDGNICFQTSIDATDGQSHAYPTEFQNRCNIVLQPRGGQVYIGTNPGTGNTTYKLYVNSKIFSNGGFVKNGSSDSYVLLGGGGHKAESSLRVAYASNADMVDGYHENSFLRYRGVTKTDQEATLWSQIGIKEYQGALPDGLTGTYNWGSVISLPGRYSRFEIYASHLSSSSGNGLYYRSGWNSDKRTWLKLIDSSTIGSQTVANAYHLRINAANTWSTWYWAGQSGQPSWLWGSNDGTNMYVWNPSNFRVAYASSAGNADTLDGYPANGSNDRPYGHIPTIESDGVMEVGRYIDFHNDNNGKHDFSTRLQSTGNYGNEVNLPSASGTLALINDVNNYYWANVKISASSSTTTSPAFSNVYLGNSLHLNNRGPNSIYNGPNDSANGVGGPLNNLVFSSWQGVSFTTSCAGLTYTNKNAVSINCRTGQLYAREVQANGFMHTDHNNNDAVLLAGGGYRTLRNFIFLNRYDYTDYKHYNLSFHKCINNLVWVDGHVKGYIAENFVIDPSVFPYRYDEDPDLETIYLMTENSFITINAIGVVTINNAAYHKQRVGFFYVGRD